MGRANKPPQRELKPKALNDAERELGEREFEECLEAVEDAKEVSEGAPIGGAVWLLLASSSTFAL
jgi:hypothetical protein